MGAKLKLVLFAVFLACCLLSSSKCEGDGMKRSTGGYRRLQLDGGEQMAAAGSNKLVVTLCFRKWCGNWEKCYCCEMKPSLPCFADQHKCWDACPGVPPGKPTSPSTQ